MYRWKFMVPQLSDWCWFEIDKICPLFSSNQLWPHLSQAPQVSTDVKQGIFSKFSQKVTQRMTLTFLKSLVMVNLHIWVVKKRNIVLHLASQMLLGLIALYFVIKWSASNKNSWKFHFSMYLYNKDILGKVIKNAKYVWLFQFLISCVFYWCNTNLKSSICLEKKKGPWCKVKAELNTLSPKFRAINYIYRNVHYTLSYPDKVLK